MKKSRKKVISNNESENEIVYRHIYLSDKTDRILSKWALKEKKTTNQIIHEILEKYVREHEIR